MLWAAAEGKGIPGGGSEREGEGLHRGISAMLSGAAEA